MAVRSTSQTNSVYIHAHSLMIWVSYLDLRCSCFLSARWTLNHCLLLVHMLWQRKRFEVLLLLRFIFLPLLYNLQSLLFDTFHPGLSPGLFLFSSSICLQIYDRWWKSVEIWISLREVCDVGYLAPAMWRGYWLAAQRQIQFKYWPHSKRITLLYHLFQGFIHRSYMLC